MLGVLCLIAPVSLLAFAPVDGPLHVLPSPTSTQAATSAMLRPAPAPPPAYAPPAPPPRPAAPLRETLRRLVALRSIRSPKLESETKCLAQAVVHEAANQGLRGQLAVAQVILNRMRSTPFPKSACGVVNQRGQFDGAADYEAPDGSAHWKTAVAIATIAQERRVAQVAPGALFFHATYVRPSWSETHERVAQIGDQIFYR